MKMRAEKAIGRPGRHITKQFNERTRLIMKMKWVLISVAMISCNSDKHDNPVAPLPLDHNVINMKVGDSWLFQRQFINIPDSGTIDFPDTLTGYSYFEATKDTAIEGKQFLIIAGRDYEIEKDSIVIYKKRSAIHLGDTVLMYEFNTGDWGFMSGLMKRQTTSVSLSKMNYGTTVLKKRMLQKLLVSSGYDTSVYYDFVYPMVFPLIEDSAYVYRDSGDARGNLFYRKRFLGTENITIHLGQFESYKFEYMANEALGIDSILFYDWVGLNGLLKRYVDGGYSDISDTLGNVTARVRTFDISELIGRNDIDPDTLRPWGNP